MATSLNDPKHIVLGDERCRFRPLNGGGLRMVLRLTMLCNLACPHCLATEHRDVAELTTKEWLTLIMQFPDLHIKKVLLTGGEPLLRDDILTIIDALSCADITTDLNSNLQRTDRDSIRDLKHAGISEISVSLEGPEDIHDHMHGRVGSFARLIDAIGWAAENGIPVDTSCCLTMENYEHITDLINIMETLPVRSLTFSRLLPIGHGYHSRQALTQEQLNRCYQLIQSQVTSGTPIPIRATGLLGAPQQIDCGRGNSLIAITPDGTLMGCVLSDDNPCVAHPLEVGLQQALEILRKELFRRQYALCWQDGI
jgi:MoaA/NifB/PqqE/SkfB family radical SAM enzyme